MSNFLNPFCMWTLFRAVYDYGSDISLTSPQVDHAVFPAQSGLDFHSEAHFFAD